MQFPNNFNWMKHQSVNALLIAPNLTRLGPTSQTHERRSPTTAQTNASRIACAIDRSHVIRTTRPPSLSKRGSLSKRASLSKRQPNGLLCCASRRARNPKPRNPRRRMGAAKSVWKLRISGPVCEEVGVYGNRVRRGHGKARRITAEGPALAASCGKGRLCPLTYL
jgi:hypothetical protein